MITLTIDNQQVTVEPGSTILDAATALGIEVPTLCHRPDCTPQSSCLVCVVKVRGRSRMVPSCSTPAEQDMVVESESPAVRDARRTALELLLSDHTGDCLAPCHRTCPAHMDIPRMVRQMLDRDWAGAIKTVKRDIPFPAVLGRMCSAPCEAGCHHRAVGGSISVCLLKRFVADRDLQESEPYLPSQNKPTGKRVAIVGAGPSGLSAAYFLAQAGHECDVYEAAEAPGGQWRTDYDRDALDPAVLDSEIDVVRRLGVRIHTGRRLGDDLSLGELRQRFDAVLLATGGVALEVGEVTPPVFSARGRPGRTRIAVRGVEAGKHAAAEIDAWMSGGRFTGARKPFSVTTGKLCEDEVCQLLSGHQHVERTDPAAGLKQGMTLDEALAEAGRCLQCGCQQAGECRLRRYSMAYEADPGRYQPSRRRLQPPIQHGPVRFEPGKCIACGLCIDITRRAAEPLGLTFIGRGFDVRLAPPFNHGFNEAMRQTALQCVRACPTGALSMSKQDT